MKFFHKKTTYSKFWAFFKVCAPQGRLFLLSNPPIYQTLTQRGQPYEPIMQFQKSFGSRIYRKKGSIHTQGWSGLKISQPVISRIKENIAGKPLFKRYLWTNTYQKDNQVWNCKSFIIENDYKLGKPSLKWPDVPRVH